MVKRALFPEGSQAISTRLQISPGVLCDGFVFLTGVTGSSADDTRPADLEVQFHSAFRKIGAVLEQASVSFDAIVEMTSYHVGLREHFDLFCQVRAAYLREPFPAWTAVEVPLLRREGAAVEIRVIAACPQ